MERQSKLCNYLPEYITITVEMAEKLKYRKHIRLEGFDYSGSHYYFVTICTDSGEKLFEPQVSGKYGHKIQEEIANVVAEFTLPNPRKKGKASFATTAVERSKATTAIENQLLKLPERFPNLEIDFYIFMPTHIHIIFAIEYVVAKFTLPRIIQAFKSLATREAKQALQLPPGTRIFQPNYYEHIIRSEDALNNIRTYTLRNPWIEYDEINWKKLDPS